MSRNLNAQKIRARYLEAKRELPKNVWQLPQFYQPVLTCGLGYPGIWLEHNLDNLFYADIDPKVAMAGIEIFFKHQRTDGLFPALVRRPTPDRPDISYGQIQSVISHAFVS